MKGGGDKSPLATRLIKLKHFSLYPSIRRVVKGDWTQILSRLKIFFNLLGFLRKISLKFRTPLKFFYIQHFLNPSPHPLRKISGSTPAEMFMDLFKTSNILWYTAYLYIRRINAKYFANESPYPSRKKFHNIKNFKYHQSFQKLSHKKYKNIK